MLYRYMYTWKQMMFRKTFQWLLKQDLTLWFDKLWVEQTLPKEKNKKVISVMKDELGGKIMTEFSGLKARAHSYLTDDGREGKHAKGIKNIS